MDKGFFGKGWAMDMLILDEIARQEKIKKASRKPGVYESNIKHLSDSQLDAIIDRDDDDD